MTDFIQKKCVPCEGIVGALGRDLAQNFLSDVIGWKLTEDARGIYRQLELKDFSAAIAVVGEIAKIAENQGHHPDLHLTAYRRLRIDLTTHAINGLSENDFILAAKINEILKGSR